LKNPFTSGQIKNYLLFYASVVVIMILFFIATTLFHDVQTIEKKKFAEENRTVEKKVVETKNVKSEMKFKLMDVNY
jgi:hypothetical protein